MSGLNFDGAGLHKEVSLNLLKAQIFFAVLSIDQVDHLNTEGVVWEQCIGQIEGDRILCFCAIISCLNRV